MFKRLSVMLIELIRIEEFFLNTIEIQNLNG